MFEWKQILLDAAKERWHTKTGLLAALALVTFPLVVAFAGIKLEEVSWREWTVVTAAGAVVVLVWLKTRLPRVPRGKVGFGVAIYCEEADSSRQLCSDFAVALRDNLSGSRFRHEFMFVELPASIASQLTDQDRAASVARRANIHFLLYGRARLRSMPAGAAYVIDLRGVVRHAAVDRIISQQFGKEFGSSLPNRMVLPSDHSFVSCEVAAKHVEIVAKYIIGTAAALSNDFEYAEQLLLDSEIRLKQYVEEVQGVPLSVMLDRVQTRLRELYQEWITRLIRQYTLKRDVAFLRPAEAIVSKLRRYDSSNYAARLVSAMCAFVLRRDVAAAKHELEPCRVVDDATWRYSQAFLEAYDGDLDAAYRCYSKAFSAPLEDPTVPTQSEEFIQIVLDAEPDRSWLSYCLGLINYRAKGDLEAAEKDFRRFLATADAARFPKAVDSARKWLREIEALSPSAGTVAHA